MAKPGPGHKGPANSNPKSKSRRNRRRRRLQGRNGVAQVRTKTEVKFMAPPTGPDGRNIWTGLNGWWYLALELVSLVIGWVMTKSAPAAIANPLIEARESHPGQETPEPTLYFYSANDVTATKNPLDKTVHDILLPVASCSRVAVSIDNFVSRSPYVRANIRGNPKNAPSPYNGDVAMFTNYFTIPYTRYRLKSVSFQFSDEVQAMIRCGVYHFGFQPYGVNEYFNGFAQDGKEKGLPRLESIKAMLYYRRLTVAQKSTSIVWKPHGYWAEWRLLGLPVETVGELAIGDVLWNEAYGGVGTAPFGELAMMHEIDNSSSAALTVNGRPPAPIYMPEDSTITISCNATYELSGNELVASISTKSALSTISYRIIRGYWMQPWNTNLTENVYQCKGYLFRDRRYLEAHLDLDQMAIN